VCSPAADLGTKLLKRGSYAAISSAVLGTKNVSAAASVPDQALLLAQKSRCFLEEKSAYEDE
jgi:hypothetical protein